MAPLNIAKKPLGPTLWLAGHHCGPFIVGGLPLWQVLWLDSYQYGPFHGLKVTFVARYMVGMLPLWHVLCLVSFIIARGYVWLAIIMAHLWLVSHDYDPFYEW